MASKTYQPMVVVTRGGAAVLLGCDPSTAEEILAVLRDPAVAQQVPLEGNRASDYYKIVIDRRDSKDSAS